MLLGRWTQIRPMIYSTILEYFQMEECQIVTIKEDEDMIISPDSVDCSEESVLPRYSTLHVSCFHDCAHPKTHKYRSDTQIPFWHPGFESGKVMWGPYRHFCSPLVPFALPFSVVDPESHVFGLIWLSRVRNRIGNADPDPGAIKNFTNTPNFWLSKDFRKYVG